MAPLTRLLHVLTWAVVASLVAAPTAVAGVLSPKSGGAEDIRTIAIITFAVVVVLGLALHGAIVAALARRHAEPEPPPAARGLQVRVAVALGSLAAALFVLGVIFTESARKAEPTGAEGLSAEVSRTAQVNPRDVPRPLEDALAGRNAPVELTDPLVVRVIGQQWIWRFEHPGGRAGARNFSYEELVVPTDTLVALDVTSIDVLHRWWVPELGGKVDAVPGQTSRTWLNVAEEGVYRGRSAAYSGPGYPAMQITVRAVSPQEYEAYLTQLEEELEEAQQGVLEAEDELEPVPEQQPDEVEGE